MKRAVGYVRVSSIGQAVEGISLEAQRAKILAWCDYNEYELSEIFSDEGISGKKASNRPGLQQALNSIGKGDVLVFYSLSRLARSTKDAIAISELLQKQDAHFVSLSEDINTTSAAGKMIFRMLAVLAEFERDLVSERTCFALQHKKRSGYKTGGDVPYGYDVINGKLIENHQEQEVISRILALRAKGYSMRKIANSLNEDGILTKRGKHWQATQVQGILKRAA